MHQTRKGQQWYFGMKVEHAFRYIKWVFGYSKVRYRGLAKNNNRLHVLAGFTNLLRARKYLRP
jgi:IS5 family transposase